MRSLFDTAAVFQAAEAERSGFDKLICEPLASIRRA